MDEQRRLLSMLKAGPEASRNDILIQELERNVKHMKESSKTMEKENIEMERKIGALKEKLNKDREERERMGGASASRWRSSNSINPAKKVEKKTPSKRVLKVLTDQPVESYKQPVRSAQGYVFRLCGQCDNRRVKVECNECGEFYCSLCYKQFHSKGALRKHTWKAMQTLPKSSAKGQKSTSASTASLQSKDSFVQSDDNDENGMFQDVNVKVQITISGVPAPKTPKPGLLPSGRTSSLASRPIDSGEFNMTESWLNDSMDPQYCSPVTTERHHRPQYANKNSFHSSTSEQSFASMASDSSKKSLLDGTYDEEANAAAFRDALREWRNGGKTTERSSEAREKRSSSTCVGTDSQMQTKDLSPKKLEVNVQFSSNSSLSYLDQIIVKKHKANPSIFLSQPPTSLLKQRKNDDNMSLKSLSRSPSPKNIPNKKDSPRELSPRGSVTGSTRSSNSRSPVLSIRFSPQGKMFSPSTVGIDITPYDEVNDSNDEGTIESNVEPVVTETVTTGATFDSKENQTGESQPALRAEPNNHVNIIELNFYDDVNGSGHLPDIKRPATAPQSSSGVDKKMWRPKPEYKSTSDFFLMGVDELPPDHIAQTREHLVRYYNETAENNANEQQVDMTLLSPNYNNNSTRDQNILPGDHLSLLSTSKLDCWTQQGSYDHNLVQERRSSYDMRSNRLGSYDFLRAPPPIAKGDNYDKVHRCSTSLSISAPPVDIWSDSRRSSCQPPATKAVSRDVTNNNNNNSNDTITEGRTSAEQTKIELDSIDQLAEQVLNEQNYYDTNDVFQPQDSLEIGD